MTMVRVINLSNNSITVANIVILAKKIRDFEEDSLSEEDFATIAAYSSSGVIKAFRYNKPEIVKKSNRKKQNQNEEE